MAGNVRRPKPAPQPQKMKIKKGDTVQVLAGKDRGHTGVVERVMPLTGKVIVEGAHMVKRHQRQTSVRMKGGIIDKALPIDASNVALVCSKDGPTRVGTRIDDDGTKHRICRKCGKDL